MSTPNTNPEIQDFEENVKLASQGDAAAQTKLGNMLCTEKANSSLKTTIKLTSLHMVS